MYIADTNNHRIVGSASNQLSSPQGMSFDSYGNMYIVDTNNRRIQKLVVSCDNTISTANPTTEPTSPEQMTSIRNHTSILPCSLPMIVLIPTSSAASSPIQFRRSEDISIVSIITSTCNNSLSLTTQWTIRKCIITCIYQIQLNSSIGTTFSEIYIPKQTLPYGVYQLILTVTLMNTSSSSSSTVYIEVVPSDITVNLISYGTSMITQGYNQDIQFDPGQYSIDPDEKIFNLFNWEYRYYCRIYGLYEYPNLNNSLLTVDDLRIDPYNPSCLSNRTGFQFYNAIQSSLTILSNSLQSNRTYQFMVRITNRQNSSLQSTGSLLIKVEQLSSPLVLIGCVIETMCVSNSDEFQLLNPTTQVALFSICDGNCTVNLNITWNVYYGQMNSSANVTQWTLFNQTNLWFFGMNTTNFTVTNQLFLSNPQIDLWKFEVVYTFLMTTSSSSLNFLLNQSPSNGSCRIHPFNGTISDWFTISCQNWFDQNGIKDYTLYAWTNNPTERMAIAYSSISTYEVRLPMGDNQTSLLQLSVQIRDHLDCVTEVNVSSVIVRRDTAAINDFISAIQNSSSELSNNQIVQLLASRNQNIVVQILTSISQQLNDESVQQILSIDGLSTSSISFSSVNMHNLVLNQSVLTEYQTQLNSRATARDYLITFITKLPITTSNSVKIQSSSLSQLTKATNELTRSTLSIAADRCYHLASALYLMRTQISFEDIQSVSTDLVQCAANLLSAVNGPLQERTMNLDLDSSRANTFPQDYDTDLDSDWSNPNLFADGDDFSWETIQKNRNVYYQKQSFNQIVQQVNELISLITSSLNTHLNIGQRFLIDSSQVFMTLEITTLQSLTNGFVLQIGNGQVQLPDNFSSFLDILDQKLSIRSIMEPLAPFGNSSLSSSTNLSRLISFSFVDQNQNELSIRTMTNKSIEINIPRDPNLLIPSMILQNVTSMNSTPHHLIYHYHYLNITSNFPTSIHWQIQPLSPNVSYLFIYKFDGVPQLNTSMKEIDGWTVFCSSNLINESIYTYFLDNQRTLNHQSIIFGLRELNSTEVNRTCSSNASTKSLPITNEPFHFTSNYQMRMYSSGCYYLDENNQWKSDGLIVGSLTNLYQTQCYSRLI
ncbi:unnamed protein product [Adineta ricciae]|uniref:PKD/REJ-like domain-containing protein n=1 Tax=Adineta ricciae TaxID=249248 RepID=A0A815ZC24_ADIRI|nr:unnamed protein product [Adineta ricciae]CAF1582890.1 unnamed protein product [Adineta ricciae]